VARNVLATQRRGGRRRHALTQRLGSATAAESADTETLVPRVGDALDDRLAGALAKLASKDREALTLVAWDGLEPHEAAFVLGESPGTFRVRLHRARGRLRGLLEERTEPVRPAAWRAITTGGSPAFAVTRNPNGTVTVKLIRFSGIVGANRTLAAMGVRAKLVTAVRAMAAARFVAALAPCHGQPAGTLRTVTFDPASIPRDRLLLVGADHAAHLRYYSGTLTGAPPLALRRARSLIKRARAIAVSIANGHRSTRYARAGTPFPVATGLPRTLRVYCGRTFSWPAARGG
jgi:hypothetical protein